MGRSPSPPKIPSTGSRRAELHLVDTSALPSLNAGKQQQRKAVDEYEQQALERITFEMSLQSHLKTQKGSCSS